MTKPELLRPYPRPPSSSALHHAEEDGGRGYGRSSSGFVITCGLGHIRHPSHGHPPHGRLPFPPAPQTAHGEGREECGWGGGGGCPGQASPPMGRTGTATSRCCSARAK